MQETTKKVRAGGRPGRLLRGMRGLLVALLLAGSSIFVAAPGANASWYLSTVSTRSGGVNVRDCYHPVNRSSYPSTACTYVTYLAPGTALHIVCQRWGQPVSGPYGTTALWDYVVVNVNGRTYEGYATDAYIYTGSNGFVAEVCR